MFEKYNHNLDLHFVVYPNKMRLVTAKFPFLQKLTHMTKVRYASGNVFFYITWFPRKQSGWGDEGSCSRKKGGLWKEKGISWQGISIAVHRGKAALYIPWHLLVAAAAPTWSCPHGWSYYWSVQGKIWKMLNQPIFNMLVMIKVCEAARINYSEMIKFVRRECKCKSKVCLNWECTCMVDDETGELGDCVCPPCDCPSCISCQVYNFSHSEVKVNHWYVSPFIFVFFFFKHRWR